jgi:DNA polymerase III delta prime subunit
MHKNIDYTPKTIDDIIYQSVTQRRLIKDIATGAMQFPMAGKNGILLYGIYGTGKTTLARMLPDAIERGKGGEDSYFTFIPCEQGNNGAKLMASLRNSASFIAWTHSGYHYFVLDEVDNLTDAALASLKSAMNVPNTIFIMTTNHISKIDAGVQNRSERINFNAAPAAEWLPLARQVLEDCGAHAVSDSVLLPIIDGCKGSVRELVSDMQKIASAQHANGASIQIHNQNEGGSHATAQTY